jgi:hypothetical protein
MRRDVRLLSFALVPIIIAGCTVLPGITQLQDAVAHFDQSTHLAADAEETLLRAERLIDIDNQFYDDAVTFATTPGGNFDLTANYTPRQITAHQIETRVALLCAITLYADKMHALACGNDDATLDTNSANLAGKLSALAAKKITLTPGTVSVATDVAVGIEAIARLALDNRRAKDLKTTAQQMQPHLAVVVAALKNENALLGKNIGNDLGKIELDLRVIAAKSREELSVDPADAHNSSAQKAKYFFAVVAGRQLLHSELIMTPLTVDAVESGPISYNSVDYARTANAALDAILSGNQAIASAGVTGIYAAANDISQRAKAAQSFASTLTAGK